MEQSNQLRTLHAYSPLDFNGICIDCGHAEDHASHGQACHYLNQSKDTKGIKYDLGKTRMDLLPMDALLEVAKVLTFGANKYGDRNWEKGIDVQRLRAAQLRHDAAVEMGELTDSESGLLHTAHKACDALMELALRIRNAK